jgi:hypothetical protein
MSLTATHCPRWLLQVSAAVADDPRNPELLWFLALILYDTGRHRDALGTFADVERNTRGHAEQRWRRDWSIRHPSSDVRARLCCARSLQHGPQRVHHADRPPIAMRIMPWERAGGSERILGPTILTERMTGGQVGHLPQCGGTSSMGWGARTQTPATSGTSTPAREASMPKAPCLPALPLGSPGRAPAQRPILLRTNCTDRASNGPDPVRPPLTFGL